MNHSEARSQTPHIGSFAEAAEFRLRVALTLSYLELLRDLESMWDFNETAEAQNPRLQRIVSRLRKR